MVGPFVLLVRLQSKRLTAADFLNLCNVRGKSEKNMEQKEMIIKNIECSTEYLIDKYLLECKPQSEFLPTRYIHFLHFLREKHAHKGNATREIFDYTLLWSFGLRKSIGHSDYC